MKLSKSSIVLIAALGLFFIYIFGQNESSLEIIDFSIDKPETQTLSITSNEDRNPYYGDLHVHTSYSFDAYVFGITATPDDAYRYAKGEGIKHPMGYEMKLREPLDFYAVTDHGIFLGMVNAMADTTTKASQQPISKPFHNLNRPENLNEMSFGQRANLFSTIIGGNIVEQHPYWHPRVIRAWLTKNSALALKVFDYDVHKSAWADIARAAEEHNDPGKFTSFIGYEFTSSTNVEGGNLHRNVIFNSSEAPIRPWSRIDSINPEDLWTWMDKLRDKGVDSLAMPHNSNGSNGQMFEMETFRSYPIDNAYSEKRMRNEPIVEITQVKGTSETHPLLSPDDDWADFEIMNKRIGSRPPVYSMAPGGYVRDAYLRGLRLEWTRQGNPYKFGLIGSSDSHTGAGAYDENNYWSKVGLLDGTAQARGSVPLSTDRVSMLKEYAEEYRQPLSISEEEQGTYTAQGFFDQWGAAGLAVAWAEENTRDSIFAAFKRKETFATTGTRMAVRFFAGYDMQSIDLNSESLIKQAYAKGVPMGADLMAEGTESPDFIVWAQRDKNGSPLQRIQIIKGWIEPENSVPHEMIYDVVCSDGLSVDPVTHRCPDNGARVNITDCSITQGVGATELKSTWSDPDFDPKAKSFYYVRVLENPTCRWSTWDAIKAGLKPRAGLHETIQERAWTSPIWFVPPQDDLDIIPLAGSVSAEK